MQKPIIAAVLALSLAASGCASTGGGGPSAGLGGKPRSAAAASLRQQQVEYQRIQEGVMTGAVIGALLGAGLGLAAGGKNRGEAAALGGLIGAGVGGAAGGAYAQNVNQQTREVAAQKEGLQKVIEQAGRSVSQAQRLNATATSLANEEQSRISSLTTQLRAGKITAATYRAEISDARDNIRILENARDQIDADIGVLQRASQQRGGAETVGRANQLRAEKARLEGQLTRLRSTYDRIPSEVGGV